MPVREAHNSFSWKGHGIGLRVKGDQMRAPPTYPRPNLNPFAIKLTDPTAKPWLNPICIRRPLV